MMNPEEETAIKKRLGDRFRGLSNSRRPQCTLGDGVYLGEKGEMEDMKGRLKAIKTRKVKKERYVKAVCKRQLRRSCKVINAVAKKGMISSAWSPIRKKVRS